MISTKLMLVLDKLFKWHDVERNANKQGCPQLIVRYKQTLSIYKLCQ